MTNDSEASQEVFLGLGEATTSPRVARDVVARALQRWGVSRVQDTVVLLVSELVTNAVLHAQAAPEMRLYWNGESVRVEVSDADQRRPTRQPRAGLETAGRGLGLVEDLSTSWGTYLDQERKVVWFELRVDDQA
ncbi:MAG: ATP-binding protein [Acidimicrobiales bacterium]